LRFRKIETSLVERRQFSQPGCFDKYGFDPDLQCDILLFGQKDLVRLMAIRPAQPGSPARPVAGERYRFSFGYFSFYAY
jgi:hypothetical protein